MLFTVSTKGIFLLLTFLVQYLFHPLKVLIPSNELRIYFEKKLVLRAYSRLNYVNISMQFIDNFIENDNNKNKSFFFTKFLDLDMYYMKYVTVVVSVT